jgi:hypothetical protein
MSPGGRNTGSSGSITERAGNDAASASSSVTEASGHARKHSCSSHNPITLRR